MKRVTNLFPRITDRDNLRFAFYRALRGKRDRADVREFAAALESNLLDMALRLQTGTFSVGRCSQFTIHDPKRRTITAPCFPERVLHHAIMNVCEPEFERVLIDDTYACRLGRGRIAAVQRARHFSARFPVALKLDVRKYFDSISHEVLAAQLKRRFKDGRLLELFQRIVAAYETQPGRGLPIGSLTSQHLANFYLARFDRFVKESLRIRGYVRYMDDCVVWGESAAAMREILSVSGKFLESELRLQFKQPLVQPTRHGIEFLGCRVFPTHLTLNRRSRSRFRVRLEQLEAEYLSGRIDERTLQERGTALLAFTKAGGTKSWRFRTRVLQRSAVSGQRARTG